MSEVKSGSSRRVITGTVVSSSMEKTAVVQSSRKFAHPVYKKYVSRRVKYMVHDENNELAVGDTVQIVETRPLSRKKRWRLLSVVEKGPLD